MHPSNLSCTDAEYRAEAKNKLVPDGSSAARISLGLPCEACDTASVLRFPGFAKGAIFGIYDGQRFQFGDH